MRYLDLTEVLVNHKKSYTSMPLDGVAVIELQINSFRWQIEGVWEQRGRGKEQGESSKIKAGAVLGK